MRTFTRTLQTLSVIDDELCTPDGRLFDRASYSRFKYGYTPPGVQYGVELAMLIADELFQFAGNEPVVIVSAPYKYLPTASHVIAQSLLRQLSLRAVMDGREPPVLVPFHKAKMGDSTYARSDETERLNQLATLGLFLDESRIAGSHVLVVDDIRITGSAEKATAAYLESLNPASIWYLHAARLDENVGKTHPHLEDELNQTVQHAVDGFLVQMAAGQFQLNTRVLRYLLEITDRSEFVKLLAYAPRTLLEEIHQAAVGNGLAYYRTYRFNLGILHSFLLGSSPVAPLVGCTV